MAELGFRRTLHVHVASAGNEVMAHIAALIAEGCTACGATADVVVDGLPLDDAARGIASVIVAPHEFFPLHFLRTRPTIEVQPTLDHAAVLNVEQPGSEWFDTACEFARLSRQVFDISPAGVAEFRRRGVTAVHTPLGYSESLEAHQPTPTGTRPIDVLFFGHASPRRHAFFARHAGFFSSVNAHILLSDVDRPRNHATDGYWSGVDRLGLVSSSRLVLCVHSTERPYFEQHRAMLALANGSLLITETSRHTAPLEEGVHFVSAPLDDLPELCRRYLSDPHALDEIAGRGREYARSRLHIRQSAAIVLEALARGSRPAGEDDTRAAVRARLADSLASRTAGNTPWTTHPNRAYRDVAPPAVTVLVTLFNYRRHVTRCLASVIAADLPEGGVEIVVVDDASTDDGGTVVETSLAQSNVPAMLVRKTSNTGVADARNVGLALARGRQVFVLDADNWLYPRGLRLLQAELARTQSAAAYGHIARIDETTGDGLTLMSSFSWSPARLVERPYLDAMALFDRQALLDVGGYSTELLDHGWFGWEDYDLWLKLAQAGRAAAHVPQIVAGYCDHPASMLGRTNLDSERVATYFRKKFATLIGQHPGLATWFSFPAPEHQSPEHDEIATLRDHATALERQLADVYASRSWQLTAPLRTAMAWLGRKR